MEQSKVVSPERADEFVQAARELHAQGMEWFYSTEVCAQMVENSEERPMRIRKLARSALNFAGIHWLDEASTKMHSEVYATMAHLEHNGVLESANEAPWPDDPSQPKRRLYRLIESTVLDPVAQSAA